MFADISKLNMSTFGVVVVAVIIIEAIMLIIIRYFTELAGKNINLWYDNFGLSAVLLDIGISVLGIIVTMVIYRTFVFPTYGWSINFFVPLLVLLQQIHDFFLYKFVVLPIPKGHNAVIDIFKAYGKSGGFLILFYDGLMVAGAALIASILYSYPAAVSIIAGTAATYVIPYILYTRNEYSTK
jgi:hypothetical protein